MLFAEPPFLKFERIIFCHKFINPLETVDGRGRREAYCDLDSPVVHV